MEQASHAGVEPGEPLLLDLVLYPYRSLTPRGFALVMAVLATIGLVAGILFVAVGAWPVVGFFGVDVALVYWCLRSNFRAARLHETVQLTERVLTIRRVSAHGRVQSWTFQPHWLRVELPEANEVGAAPAGRLTLSSHGRSLAIGGFLAPDERAGLARTLRQALADLRDRRAG